MNKGCSNIVSYTMIVAIAIIGVSKINIIPTKASSVPNRTSKCCIIEKHDFSIMSQNVKYEEQKDGKDNTFDKRSYRLSKQLKQYNTDIKCFQEVNKSWRSYITDQLSLNDYHFVQSPYENTKLSNVILVKKSRFSYINSGYMMLTSTSSDTSNRSRYAAWMKVKHKRTGNTLVIMNVHTTPYSAELIKYSCEKIMSSPVIKNADRYIIAGDFNMRSRYHAEAYNTMLLNGTKDMCKAAKTEGKRYIVGGTFHKWEKVAASDRKRIDYFFGSSNLNSTMYTLLNDKYDGGFVSDHYGIMNYITFK